MACFDVLRTECLVDDLNNLDAALAVMLRSLEIRDIRFLGFTYPSLTYPAIFLKDVEALVARCSDIDTSATEKNTLTEYFTETQPAKQCFAGFATNLPNAGDFKCEKTHPTLCGDIIVSAYTAYTIKDTDMSLQLADLMYKCHQFSQDRASIQGYIDTWSLSEMDAAEHQKKTIAAEQDRFCLLTAHMAPSFVTGHVPKQCRPVAHAKTQALKDMIQARKAECYRTNTQNLRETMMFLAKCSPVMQNALRPGLKGLSVMSASVGAVRAQWEHELHSRALCKSPHPADLCQV
jgi:hypothetical protein